MTLSHLQKASVVSMCGAAAADATNTAHLRLFFLQWCGRRDADDCCCVVLFVLCGLGCCFVWLLFCVVVDFCF